MNLALFASGTGSNVKNIIDFFKKNETINIVLVVSNNSSAGALIHAKNNDIEQLAIDKAILNESIPICETLHELEVELVVLAGFLLKIPEKFISNFKGKIINLHPSLLPKFGGKGMYGNNVHKAVLGAKEKKTGITIHFVNENYDEGAIIDQFETALSNKDDLDTIVEKIKKLEKLYFPPTIERLIHKL
ncbi:MAG: phosphoribosylglycinamide formyltransferase [Flavobacteriales bacterium]|nr:phosphoribosylglycinamide formyltransferase [Flavobacteriales bacterium]